MKIFKNKLSLYLTIIITLVLGNLSGLIAASQTEFYKVIKLPFFAPPAWVFAPVWTVLYILIGFSFYKLISNKNNFSHLNNILYVSGFILNLLWSFVFFTQENFGFALIMLIGMWLITLYFIVWVSRKETILIATLTPYLLWLTFAGSLNLAILLIN